MAQESQSSSSDRNRSPNLFPTRTCKRTGRKDWLEGNTLREKKLGKGMKAVHLSRLGREEELKEPASGRKEVYLEKRQGVRW